MRFLAPQFLIWSSLLAAALLLYLVRRRPRTLRVSTLPFFKSLAKVHQESAWLRRLKQILSFLLTAAVLLLAVGALAQLVWAPSADAVSTVVIVVDRSASMAARDAAGQTRLDAVRDQIRQRLAGLSASTGIQLVAYDQRPEILLPRTYDRRALLRALDDLAVRPIEGRSGEALIQAQQLAALAPPAVIWHATDGPLAVAAAVTTDEQPVEPAAMAEPSAAAAPSDPPVGAASDPVTPESPPDAAPAPVEVLASALPAAVNVGLTGFQLRRQPLTVQQWQAFVQVHASGPGPLSAQLETRFDGRLVGIRQLNLQPGQRERLLIDVDSAQCRTLSLRIAAEGDVLALDNELLARVPEFRPLKVGWFVDEPDPFTHLALTSLGEESGFAVFQSATADWPPAEELDLLIFDGWLPPTWPLRTPVLAISPPSSLGPLRVAPLPDGFPLDTVRAVQPDHPLLLGVASQRVALTQTSLLEATGSLEPLWVGAQGPALAAGEVSGQRIAVLAFTPQASPQLPLLASFPLLLGNALFWAAEPLLGEQTGNNLATGEIVPLETGSLRWTALATQPATAELPAPISSRSVLLDQIGIWETDAGRAGSAALCSAAETLLPQAASTVEAPLAGRWFSGDFGDALLALVLCVLVLESGLFHRWAVY